MADVAAARAARIFPSRLQGSAVVDGLVGKAGELTSQALLLVLLPRLLGPVDYGTFALVLSIVTLSSSSIAIGGPTLMSRFVPAASPAERDAVALALALRVGRWRTLGLVAAALGAAVLVLTQPDSFPPLITALVVLALALDVTATLAFQVSLGMGRTAMWSNRFGVQNLVVVIGAIAGHAVAGVTGAVAGIVVASATTFAWGWLAVGPRLAAAPRNGEIPPGALNFGGYYGASNALNMVVQRGVVVAVSLLAASKVQTGFAAIAAGFALAGIYVISQVYAVHLPGLVAGRGLSSTEPEAEAAVRKLSVRMLAVVAPVSVLAVVALDQLVPLVVGDRYSGAEAAIAVALAALPLAPLTACAGQVAALRLYTTRRLAMAAAGAAAFLVTAPLAIPAFDAAGGSAALLAGGVATALSALVAVPGALNIRLLAAGFAASGAVLLTGVMAGALG
jgi:O-antigen/teichoic acid export membrane protein